MQTTRNVLCSGPASGTRLSHYFESNKLTQDNTGRVFVDRDGKPFLAMINYLRNEC
jgi:uracil-DNA glycosylase